MQDSRDSALLLLGGLTAGVGLTLLLDPAKGRRRRALVRDKAVHLAHASQNAMTKVGHDARNRARGAAATARHLFQNEAPDDNVVMARVRSRMGRVVSHPHAIHVEAKDGKVTVSGPILVSEVDRLMSAVGAVPGVREVEDRVEVHEKADIPALQGGSPRRDQHEWLQAGWSPFTRFLSIAWGAAMLTYGFARHDGFGVAAGALGACCLTRGIVNREFREMLPLGSTEGELDLKQKLAGVEV